MNSSVHYSSLTMPSFLPSETTPCTTFSCMRLKHMASTAIPKRMYMKQNRNWKGSGDSIGKKIQIER